MIQSEVDRRNALTAIGVFLIFGGCSSRDPNSSKNSNGARINDFQRVVDSLAAWREQYARQAYRPVTTHAKDGKHVSRFGGVPLLANDEEWPTCGRCSNRMNLLLQLDLESLPFQHPHLNSGILQVFYCTYTNYDANQYCDDFEPFSECHLLRTIQNENLSLFRGSAPATTFPVAQINDWEKFTDYPSGMEHERLGLRYEYKFAPGRSKTDVHWDAGNVHYSGIVCTNDSDGSLAEAIANAAPKDKLDGWPKWIQGVQYPPCPKCQKEMTYFFQIDSEDNVPHMFGDVGCGHISYCENHPEILAFTWACS